jgi:putative flippase GtrA
MNKLLRYVRFNVVGAMGMAVQLGSLAVFSRLFPRHSLLASGVAVELAVVHNFLWHVRYTWGDLGQDAGIRSRFVRFQAANGLVSLVGNLVLIRLLVKGAGLPVLVADLAAIACCSVANFWLSDVWAFAGSQRRRAPQATRLRRVLPLLTLLLLVGGSSRGQPPSSAHPSQEGGLGSDCAYANWFVGPAFASGGKPSLNTFTGGVTFGQYFARTFGRGVTASPQFELGLVGPVPNGATVDGLGSVNAMFANRMPRRRLYPSVTIGYTRMFVTGNAVNFGMGMDFGNNEYKRLFRVELRDYYLFTGPRQHVFGLRFGLGRFISD